MASSSQPSLTSNLYPKRRNCNYPDCSNKIQNGGVCYKHGATAKMCSHPCCSNNVVNNGVCRRHGAKGRTCGHENCKTFAIKGGVCRRHGSVAKKCGFTGCTNNSKHFGVCRSHGAYMNQNPLQKAKDNPSPDSSSTNQLTGGTTTRHRAASTSNSQGEEDEVKPFASSQIECPYIARDRLTPPVNHFYNVSPTIIDLGVENFHPLKLSEMLPTLQSLEHELSEILSDCGVSSFV